MEYNEAVEAFERLFENKMSEDEARDFLVGLYERGESASEIAAAAKVMQSHSIKLEVDEETKEKLIDIVGTGGDKSNSFNISTTTSILVCSSGAYVAKHGNKGITSKSGSADVLAELGFNLNLSPEDSVKVLKECGFTFIFAINHHPAMKFIMPIRKSLNHRTIFNILGPLTNPAGAKNYLLGVFDKSFLDKIASALNLMDIKSAMVVSSNDSMDEISISDVTFAKFIQNGKISELEIDPQALGLKKADKSAIIGGDAKANAAILRGVLSGEIKDAKRDIVLLNAAAAFMVEGVCRDMKDGIERAKELIDSKKAIEKLNEIVEVSKKY